MKQRKLIGRLATKQRVKVGLVIAHVWLSGIGERCPIVVERGDRKKRPDIRTEVPDSNWVVETAPCATP